MSKQERFQIDYSPDVECVSLLDTVENAVIVLEKEQLDALVEWYAKEFHRFII